MEDVKPYYENIEDVRNSLNERGSCEFSQNEAVLFFQEIPIEKLPP